MTQPALTFEAPNGSSFTTDDNGFIKGEVTVGVEDLVGVDLESVLEGLSEKLTGSSVLSDLSYKPVRVEGESIVMEVSGDPVFILENLGIDPEDSSPAP